MFVEREMILGIDLLRLGYIGLFALTAIICLGVIPRAQDRLKDPDTRWGLTTLLALSGLWAAFHTGRLVVPMGELKIAFYILGLIVGLATVGSWLYFCSAYANRSYHRQRSFRWAALGVYAAIIGLKLTSPIHGLYFTTALDMAPFPHLVIQFGVAHWIVTGLAYALSAVGFYILFDVFQNTDTTTTRVTYPVALAGLPVILDIIGYVSQDAFLTFNYEPIGVGLFALGVLYFADGKFVAVRMFGREQLADELDAAVVLLDTDGIVRYVTAPAKHLLPALSNAVGDPLEKINPDISAQVRSSESTPMTIDHNESTRHYLLSTSQLTAGQTTVGQAIVFNEVTQLEEQRQEIQKQSSQLDDFAEAISHELRNAVNILDGRINLARSELAAGDPQSSTESLATASRMADRMTRLISDLTTMARYGRPAEEQSPVNIRGVAVPAFESAGGDANNISVDAGSVESNEVRLERLFDRLFQFFLLRGGTRVSITQADGELTIVGDSNPIEQQQIEAAFAYGQAVPDAETGILLPVARTLAEGLRWEMTVDPDYQQGVRIIITMEPT